MIIRNLQMKYKSLQILRVLGVLEGISYLLLLFIAMPLKYYAGMPEMVKYTGWAHGLLFILFLTGAAWVAFQQRWRFMKMAQAVLASLLPFGTFIFDRKLKEDQESLEKGHKKSPVI